MDHGQRLARRVLRVQRLPRSPYGTAGKLDRLLGETGQTITDLRPVGAVMFGDERVDCVAQTGQIDKGYKVTVIHVEGVRVVVREQT